MIETDLVAFIKAYAPVNNIINGRIHPMRLPDGAAFPAITYQRISGPRVKTQQQSSKPLNNPRIQMNCWGGTRWLDAANLAVALKTLDGYRGMWGTTRIDKVDVANDLDDYEPDLNLYVRRVDLIIWHKEA